MDAMRFCLWLSGYFELREDSSRKSLSPAQADLIRNKLSTVEGLGMCPQPADPACCGGEGGEPVVEVTVAN